MSSEELRSELYVATREKVHARSTHVLFFTLSDDFNLKLNRMFNMLSQLTDRAVLTYKGDVVWVETVLIFTIQCYPSTFSSVPPVPVFTTRFHP